MKYCWQDKREHCCEGMKMFLEDNRIPIDYDPKDKFYFLPLVWPYDITVQGILYCPWCGVRLPTEHFNEDKRLQWRKSTITNKY